MSDDLGWTGPLCPTCGRELDAEPLAAGGPLAVAYTCDRHGPIAMVDSFEWDGSTSS